MGVVVTGVSAVLKALDKIAAEYRAAMGKAIYQEAAAVMAVSLRQVPVDSGRLRASQYIAKPEIDASGQPFVRIGYDTEYAAAVHERTDLKHAEPTKDHFLSDPLAEALPGYAERIAKRAKAITEAGK